MASILGRVTLDQGLDNTELAGDLRSGANVDPGIAGVTVQLIDVSRNVLATTVTDANGNYSFTGLSAGQYAIKVPSSVNGAILARDNAVGPFASDGGFDGTDEYAYDSDVFTTRFNGVSPEREGESAFYDLTSNEVEPNIDVSYGFYGTGATPDGVVGGAETGEFMPVGYFDSQGDLITEGNDVIFGNGGDDDIRAGGGDDFVSGGVGGDFIDGGAGNDNLNGDEGNDDLRGEAGDDQLFGGDGNDTLAGGLGADSLVGGAGEDSFVLGADDTASGGDGDDVFLVDPALPTGGDATIVGGETGETNGDTLDLRGVGPVTLVYDTADPTFDPATGTSESGTATYTSAAGDPVTINFSEIENVLTDPDGVVDGTPSGDNIPVGFTDAQGDQVTDGPDTILAGAGNDTIAAGGGDDSVDAGTGDDFVDAGAGADSIDGGAGNDDLRGGTDNDTILGGTGDDFIDGDAGDDQIFAGDGADDLRGSEGEDFIDGGAGNDNILGEADNDDLRGGDGEDMLFGGAGDDFLDGDAGNDMVSGGDGCPSSNDLEQGA